MNLSLEALPLILLFLLPGFFVYYTRQYLTPAVDFQLDNFELALMSIGYSAVIVLFEALLFAIGLSLLGVDISALLTDAQNTAIQHPVWTLSGIASWTIISVIMACVAGAKDPYFWILRRINPDHTDTNTWFNLLVLERKRRGENFPVIVTAHLKNGNLYSGYLSEFQALPDPDGSRAFTLAKVQFIPGNEANRSLTASYQGDDSFVLLNTRNVESLDVIFPG